MWNITNSIINNVVLFASHYMNVSKAILLVNFLILLFILKEQTNYYYRFNLFITERENK